LDFDLLSSRQWDIRWIFLYEIKLSFKLAAYKSKSLIGILTIKWSYKKKLTRLIEWNANIKRKIIE
jgi:hypothetical protein